MRTFIAILLRFAISAAIPALAQDLQVTASLSSESIGLQDQLELSINVSGRDAGDAENPRLPQLRGFQLAGGPNVSSQFQWINGRVSSSKIFTYILLPEKEGQFTIDTAEVRVGGKSFRTPSLTVRVVAGSVRPRSTRPRSLDPFFDEDFARPRTRAGGEDVMVEAELDRTSAYVGQQVTVSYHLLTQVGVTGLQLQESPPLSGFWVEDLEVPPNPAGTRRIVNGREYLDYVVKKQALFPNHAGKLKIAPSTFAISAKTAGDFFGVFGQTETIYRKTKEAVLEVQPLPENKPVGFTNAVGSFNLTSSVNKSEVATGDAISLRVKLEGRGNLKVIPDIPLPPMPDFTVYSSKRADNVRPFEGDLIGGNKTWEYVMVPKAPGQQIIPALSLSYFDPQRQEYRTVSTEPVTLSVVRGGESGTLITGLSGISKQNLTRQGSDINFIKLSPSNLEPGRTPIYQAWWFYLMAALPLAFNAGAWLYQRQRSLEAGNAVLIRSRKARRLAFERLKSAEKAGRTNAREFYDRASLALSGYLSDRYQLPEIAVTADSLERALGEKDVPAEAVGEAVACLQECDFGRFVSASPSVEKMRDLARRIRNTVDTLERSR